MSLATGIRAVVLTDVVGSTELASRIGDIAAAQVWTQHDRIARDLLPLHGGREIDKTDGMLLLFDAPQQALAYALAYQAALARMAVPLQARAGLHVGPVLLRENSAEDIARGAKPVELEGLAKPTAARVASMARGGQTLLTADTVAALAADGGRDSDAPWRLRSHGHWMLRGLPEPLEVYEAVQGDAVFVAPKDSEKTYRVGRVGERWVPAAEIANNLPAQRTSFVGRESELDDIKSIVEQSPLVTLTGMGGLGKTRLALQAALEMLPLFPDGAWFVDLSPINDPALVLQETARVLDVFEEPGRPLLDTLCAWARPRKLLLVVDNCEHLMEPAGDLIDALLRHAPKLRVIASSRELLDLPGEQVYPILPLPAPQPGDDAQALRRLASVRLFAERARSQRPDFDLDHEDPTQLATLVQRLDGIPLAIELAAARLRSLSVAEILDGLGQRYQLLTGGSRVLQRRQQTLQALVDWSYNLLREPERVLLARLAAFRGRFTIGSAAAVCVDDQVPADELPTLLSSLVDKSLLLREEAPADDDGRHRLLETIREYAQGKLDGRDELALIESRHCLHYFERAKEARTGLQGPLQSHFVQRMEADLDNLRAAHAAALAGRVDPFIAVKIPVAMQTFWRLRGYVGEGRAAVRAALQMPAVQASDMAQAHALYVGAALATEQGDHVDAGAQLEQCLALRRRLGNPVDVAATLSTLALARLKAGAVEGATEAETEALQLFTEQGDRQGLAIGHEHLGVFAAWRGDWAEAGAQLNRALEVARDIGHPELCAACLLKLGEVAIALGDDASAARWLGESMQAAQSSGNRIGEARVQRWLAQVDARAGRSVQARQQLQQALRVLRDVDLREDIVDALDDLASVAFAEGETERAARLAGAVAGLRRRLALPQPKHAEARRMAEWAGWREQAGETVFSAAFAAGRSLSLADAVALALAAPAAITSGAG